MSLSGSERSSYNEKNKGRRKLFRKRDKRSRSSERYEFNDLEDEVFLRGPRKLNKEDTEGELSYDYNNPGIMRIFTGSMQHSTGVTEYKTVIVSPKSTASDVIGEVLERYELPYDADDEFFLCEVIGKLEPYGPSSNSGKGLTAAQFIEECRRIIGPEEHVLVIQALWKPLYGYYRRFELRNTRKKGSRKHRSKGKETHSAVTNGHSHVNNNVNKSVEQEILLNHESLRNGVDVDNRSRRYHHYKYRTKSVSTQVENTFNTKPCRNYSTQTEHIYFASVDRRYQKKYSIPLGPYLLLVKGFDQRFDPLVHDLYDSNVMGSDDSYADIHLRCADVNPQHCIIQSCHSDTDSDDILYSMTISPIGQSQVLINGQILTHKRALHPGDVISIGAKEMCSYVFLFKDSSQVPDRSLSMPWLSFLEQAGEAALRQQNKNIETSLTKMLNERCSAVSTSTTIPSDSILDSHSSSPESVALNFVQSSIKTVLTLYFGGAINLQQAAGLLVFACTYISDHDLNSAADEIQWQISESVIVLSQKATLDLHLDKKAHCYGEMIRACAIAFEVFLFFHKVINSASVPVKFKVWQDYAEGTMNQILDNIYHLFSEEVLFQSTAILNFESTLYLSGEAQENSLSMESFITFLTQVTRAFSSIEFESIYALRQMIMKRVSYVIAKQLVCKMLEDPYLYFKWSKGVHLRVNLDQYEEWLRLESLDAFLPSLSLVNSMVNLVATPKSHLYSMPWSNIRKSFPDIPPSMLTVILRCYDNGSGPVESLWKVTNGDKVEASYEIHCAIEDYFHSLADRCEVHVQTAQSSVQMEDLLSDNCFHDLIANLDRQLTFVAESHSLTWNEVCTYIQMKLEQVNNNVLHLYTTPPLVCNEDTFSVRNDGLVTSEVNSRSSSRSDNTVTEGVGFCGTYLPNGDKPGMHFSVEKRDIVKSVTSFEMGSQETQSERPSTPSVLNPFTSLATDIDDECTFDTDTMVNTIRNEIAAHRLLSDDFESEIDENERKTLDSLSVIEETNSSDEEAILSLSSINVLSKRNISNNSSISSKNSSYSTTSTHTVERSASQTSTMSITPPLNLEPKYAFHGVIDNPVLKEDNVLINARKRVKKPAPPPPPKPTVDVIKSRFSESASRPNQPKIIRRDSGTSSPEEVEIEDIVFIHLKKKAGQSLGLDLVDGEKTELCLPGMYVCGLTPGSPADRCKKLNYGDRILSVNNQSLINLSYSRCQMLLNQAGDDVQLLVSKSDTDAARCVLSSQC